MTESQVIKLLATFSAEEPAEPFKMADWIRYLDTTRAGWSKKKPLNMVPGSSRQKTVVAINQLQRQILKLQGENVVEFMNDDGSIPTGSVCIEAALLAIDASNAAFKRGRKLQGENFLRLACDLFTDEVLWLNNHLPNGDGSVVEQAGTLVSHLLDPRSLEGKMAPISNMAVPSHADSLRAQLTAHASAPTLKPELKTETPLLPQPVVEEETTVRDLLESIAIFALVVCYEFAILHYLMPSMPIWQIAVIVSAKAVAFRGVAFPSFLKKWERVLKPIFVIAYLPTIAVGLIGALIFKGLAWLSSPVFRNAKPAA
ncbi:hypothetical protein [Agrobacterium tumefaciens]|uniref:hypothetical protein n=1 Tax=Agrobacterium tumefaciens TaxID=358 RepID=UPI001571EE19|nr:hypothetical protein [Agrobacterium tumefaciens]